jgi:uncharacterized protein (TIGR02246 family)
MKHFLLISVVVFTAVSFTFGQEGKAKVNSNARIEEQIHNVIRKFGDAWAMNDIETLESLLTDDYVHTDYLGRVQERAEWMAYLRDRKARGIVNKIEFSDIKVRRYGDLAVVTGHSLIKGSLTEATKDVGLQIRFTQVLLKRRNRWLRSSFQATLVPQQ